MPDDKKTTPFDQEPQLALLRRRMRRAMDARGHTITSLAAACDLSHFAVSSYVSGMRLPQLVALIRISRELKVSADWLIGDDCLPSGRRKLASSGEWVDPGAMRGYDWRGCDLDGRPPAHDRERAEPAAL